MQFPTQSHITFHILFHLYHQYRTKQEGLNIRQVYSLLAESFDLTQKELDKTISSKRYRESLWKNKVRQSRRILRANKDNNFVDYVYSPKRGYWMLTNKGLKMMEDWLKPIK